MRRGAGRSVRAVSQAIGAPMASDRSPDQKASTTVFHRARPSRGSVNTRA